MTMATKRAALYESRTPKKALHEPRVGPERVVAELDREPGGEAAGQEQINIASRESSWRLNGRISPSAAA